MFTVGQHVSIIDQDQSAPVLAVNDTQVLVNFGSRWVNVAPGEPTFTGCANCPETVQPGQSTEVWGVPGKFLVLGVRSWESGFGSDVLVDCGPIWIDVDQLQLA